MLCAVLICALPFAVTVFGVALLSVNVVEPFVPSQCNSSETLAKSASPAMAYPTVADNTDTGPAAMMDSVFSTILPLTATVPACAGRLR